MNNIKEVIEILENKVKTRNIQKKMIERKIENLQEQLKEIDSSNRRTNEQILKLRTTKSQEEKSNEINLDEIRKNPNWDSIPPAVQRSLIDGTTKFSELPESTKNIFR